MTPLKQHFIELINSLESQKQDYLWSQMRKIITTTGRFDVKEWAIEEKPLKFRKNVPENTKPQISTIEKWGLFIPSISPSIWG